MIQNRTINVAMFGTRASRALVYHLNGTSVEYMS